MKCYLLLRNNEESGPYSPEELKALHLKSDDLIWEEGSSTVWKYPSEIDELKAYVPAPQKQNADIKTKSIFVSMPLSFESGKPHSGTQNIVYDNEPPLETRYCRSFEEIKETYKQRLQQRKNFFTKNHNPLRTPYWMAAVFFGLIGGAFVVKQIVDNTDNYIAATPVATATAIPVDPNTDKEIATTPPVLNNYQNALVTEPAVPLSEELPAAKTAVVKTVAPKNLKKKIRLKSNNYHVGLFGGVKDLKLSLYNHSEYPLDKVSIKVLYLKPNGQTLKEDVVEVKQVPAKGSKTVSVPPSNRGVKVDYQIVQVRSDSYQKLLAT